MLPTRCGRSCWCANAGRGAPRGLAPGVNELGRHAAVQPAASSAAARFGGPLVATSANLSGEPVLTDNAEVETRLGAGRRWVPAPRPADRPAGRRPGVSRDRRPPSPDPTGPRQRADRTRSARCDCPRPMLALGGQMKATIALGWGRRAVVSPHLGDMETPRGLALLRQAPRICRRCYGVRAEALCCDAHPGYASARLARALGVAGAAGVPPCRACLGAAAESRGDRGLDRLHLGRRRSGPDGYDLGRRGAGRRSRTLAAAAPVFARSGCSAATRRRVSRGVRRSPCSGRTVRTGARTTRTRHCCAKPGNAGLNCPPCTSIGRLFDAAAAMLGLVATAKLRRPGADASGGRVHRRRQPAHPAAVASRSARRVAHRLGAVCRCCVITRRSVASRAASFHASLAAALLEQARTLRAETGITPARPHRRRVPEPPCWPRP